MDAKKESKVKIASAAFFIAGLLLIGAFVFTIGKDKGLGQSKFQMTVLFKNVGGLMEGAPVRLAGVNVGNVASINFLPEEVAGRRVAVQLNVSIKFKPQLSHLARYMVQTEGVLGDKLVEIQILDDATSVDLSKPIYGDDSFDIQTLTEVFAGAAQSFTKTSEQLSQVDVAELYQLMHDSTKSLLITSQGLNSIMGDLQEVTRKSKRLIDRLEQRTIDGNLFKVF